MSNVLQDLFGPSVITGADGKQYTAARRLRLKDGAAYIAAVEAGASQAAILTEAAVLLKGMGFPPEVVDDLDADAAVRYASTFFTVTFQPPAA